jgi:hypothetical protein
VPEVPDQVKYILLSNIFCILLVKYFTSKVPEVRALRSREKYVRNTYVHIRYTLETRT